MAEPDEEPPLTVAEIMGLIRSDDKDDRLDGLIELSEVIDGAFGEDAALLGEEVRELEGVMVLAWLINDPEVEVQQQALLVLGNLCSDACDPNSYLTKQQLLLAGADRTITMVLQSEDANVLLYACGCIQNLCVDDEWAHALIENHVEVRLAQLLVHENYRIVSYAAGAIKNVMQRVGRSDELQLRVGDRKLVASTPCGYLSCDLAGARWSSWAPWLAYGLPCSRWFRRAW